MSKSMSGARRTTSPSSTSGVARGDVLDRQNQAARAEAVTREADPARAEAIHERQDDLGQVRHAPGEIGLVMGVVEQAPVRGPAEPQEAPLETGAFLEFRGPDAAPVEIEVEPVDVQHRGGLALACPERRQHVFDRRGAYILNLQDPVGDPEGRCLGNRRQQVESLLGDVAISGLQRAPCIAVDESGVALAGAIAVRQVGHATGRETVLGSDGSRRRREGRGRQKHHRQERSSEWHGTSGCGAGE